MTARIPATDLRRVATDILTAVGASGEDASLVADSLVQADLWDHQSHGVLRLPWYVARIRSGAVDASAIPETLVDSGPLVLLDAKDGLGQTAADRARGLAVERARQHGVGVVGVRNSNHFGTAMFYTRRGAADGCVAVLTTNASPAMAAWGGREKRLGANPWSIAAPWRDGVVALDIANTAVARGKIYLAQQRGERIPEQWALDDAGAITTDPASAIAGTILPMAGHKGYAISFMMDVLSGALTGSKVGSSVVGPYDPHGSSGAGHLFVAIDVDALGDRAAYDARVSTIVDEARGTPLAQGHERIYYPGELEEIAEAAADEAGGVALPAATVGGLRVLADELSVPSPESWAGLRIEASA